MKSGAREARVKPQEAGTAWAGHMHKGNRAGCKNGHIGLLINFYIPICYIFINQSKIIYWFFFRSPKEFLLILLLEVPILKK